MFCFVLSYSPVRRSPEADEKGRTGCARRIGQKKEKMERVSYGLGNRKEITDKEILAGCICRIPGGDICPCRDLVCLADQWKNGQRRLRVRGNI